MLISYNWLKEFIDTALGPQQLRDRLTMVGLAIDAVEQHEHDYVLDVEVPSNRPDCLSHVGIAREVAVIGRDQIKLPSARPIKTDGRAGDYTKVDIVDPDLCPRYSARLVRGVKIGPSPQWLAERLVTIGQRPINNVADITNFVLHELGQPLHAFDFAKLAQRRIVVRRARGGEKLKTLDGVERALMADMLVIADAEKPVALAGIMGGEDSEISDITVDVLIESAYFDPDSIRKTARQLGMDTEASRRFERGADREGVIVAQQRCVELICEIAGGVATVDAIDVYPNPANPRQVTLRPERVKELTSLEVEMDEMKRILQGIGCVLLAESEDLLTYQIPSWRIDIEQEEDLVEEVARHTGYDQIKSELPDSNIAGEYQPIEMKLRALRRSLTACSFDEAINFSFIDGCSTFELIPGLTGNEVELSNPIIEDASRMRQTLLPGLLGSVRHNLNHGTRDVRLFEIGRVFAGSATEGLPNERLALGMVITGGEMEEARALSGREADFFDLKGALETAVDWMNLAEVNLARAKVSHLREGQAALIHGGDGQSLGSIGRLAEDIASSYKFRQPVYVAEIDLTALFDGPEKPVLYSPLARYPSVVRDLSLLIDRAITFKEIVAAIKGLHVQDCEDVSLVGTYDGANIPPGKRSITVRVAYRSNDRTLRDDEVEERHQQLTASLLKTFGAEQR